MKLIQKFLLAVLAASVTLLSTQSSAEPVEVYLLDRINGILNHYCLDVNGPPTNMQLETPLQVHTCYSYQGDLSPDQTLDSAEIAEGKFRIAEVDMCAQMDWFEPGATVTLKECADIDEQKFDFRVNGQISPPAYPELCLTAGPTHWLGGPAGGPFNDNMARTLHLQRCGDEASRYQRWGTRTEMTAN
ncbi:MAG: RICIN domain-containing protein [Porticoccaceae bacterium]|jgi:hypothetical protein|nr:RICIN domain-containing protein [Porticoccaceae bacterium]